MTHRRPPSWASSAWPVHTTVLSGSIHSGFSNDELWFLLTRWIFHMGLSQWWKTSVPLGWVHRLQQGGKHTQLHTSVLVGRRTSPNRLGWLNSWWRCLWRFKRCGFIGGSVLQEAVFESLKTYIVSSSQSSCLWRKMSLGSLLLLHALCLLTCCPIGNFKAT